MPANIAAMTSPLAGRRVLVVDDERAIAAAVVRRLERDGAICVAAYSGTEGIERLASEPYDLVVTDIEMPNMNGLSFLKRLMRVRPMPVVMVSTLTERGADVTLKALELGAVVKG